MTTTGEGSLFNGIVGLIRNATVYQKDLVFQDDLRNGLFRRMRERERHMHCAKLGSEFGSLTVEGHRGAASGLTSHFDIPPADAVVPSRAEGFHGRFFGCEARGIALHAIGLRLTISDFAFGVDAPQEAVAETRYGFSNARHFRDFDSAANDHAAKLAHSRVRERLEIQTRQ